MEFDTVISSVRAAEKEQRTGTSKAFATALDAIGVRKDNESSLSKLWIEYIDDRFSYMTKRAHSWTISHLRTLMELRMKDLQEEVEAKGENEDDSQFQLLVDRVYDIQEIIARADYTMQISLMDFDGFEASADSVDKVETL